MKALKLVTGPAAEPVTLTEAKAHCRVDFSDDDTYIGSLISAARAHVDGQGGILNRALVYQSYDLYLDCFADCIEIPLPPLVTVDEVEYSDADGNLQTLSSASYQIVVGGLFPSVLKPVERWPGTEAKEQAVRIRFTCGYADGGASPLDLSAIPTPIKQAMLLMIGHWYESREQVVIGQSVEELPMAVNALLFPWRVPAV